MFDYQSAIKAGASEDQILEYLNKTRGYDVQGALRAGASKQQVIDYLSKTSINKQEPKNKSTLEKVADFGLKITGAKAAAKLLSPIFSAGTLYSNAPQSMKEKVLTSQGDELVNKAENEGIGSAVKDIAGTSLELGSKAAIFVNPLTSVGGRIAFGTGVGAAAGASKPLQEDASAKDIAISAGTGALVGLILSSAFEGISRLGQSRYIKNKTAGTYQKELDANKLDDIASIEYAKPNEPYKILGAQIRDAVDDKGQPLYVGSYDKMRAIAQNKIVNNSNQLKGLVSKYDDTVSASRSEVAGDIIEQIQNKVGRLKPSELKTIKFEVSKLPTEMNASELLKYKQEIYKRIPERVFDAGLDRTTSIANSAKLILTQNLKKVLNEKTADPLIQKLNNEMSLAMNVRLLTAYQIQSRLGTKLSSAGAGGTRTKIIAKIIDDLFFPTGATTRGAQALNRLGTNLDKARPSSALRTGLIGGLSNLFRK